MISAEEFDRQTAELSAGAMKENKRSVQQVQQSRLERLVNRSGIPDRFKNKSFGDFDASTTDQMRAKKICARYADEFQAVKKKGVCMVLTGQPGTGKTHLAIAILSSILQSGSTGMFITVSEMLRTIRQTYSPASKRTEQEVFDDYIGVDLLVLDEVGVSIGDDDKRRAIIFDVINGRYNQMRPCIILGNYNTDEMSEYLGVRVWDRLMESGAPVIAFDWESHRSNV